MGVTESERLGEMLWMGREGSGVEGWDGFLYHLIQLFAFGTVMSSWAFGFPLPSKSHLSLPFFIQATFVTPTLIA